MRADLPSSEAFEQKGASPNRRVQLGAQAATNGLKVRPTEIGRRENTFHINNLQR